MAYLNITKPLHRYTIPENIKFLSFTKTFNSEISNLPIYINKIVIEAECPFDDTLENLHEGIEELWIQNENKKFTQVELNNLPVSLKVLSVVSLGDNEYYDLSHLLNLEYLSIDSNNYLLKLPENLHKLSLEIFPIDTDLRDFHSLKELHLKKILFPPVNTETPEMLISKLNILQIKNLETEIIFPCITFQLSIDHLNTSLTKKAFIKNHQDNEFRLLIFNPIENCQLELPNSVTNLDIMSKVEVKTNIPEKLTKISFLSKINPTPYGKLPLTLKQCTFLGETRLTALNFSTLFSKTYQAEYSLIPPNVEKVHIRVSNLSSKDLPPNVKEIYLSGAKGFKYTITLNKSILPPFLEKLTVNHKYTSIDSLPPTVRKLEITGNNEFNINGLQSSQIESLDLMSRCILNCNHLPNTLRELSWYYCFGNMSRITFNQQFPQNLLVLDLRAVDFPLEPNYLPPNLQTLILHDYNIELLDGNIFPPTLTTLKLYYMNNCKVINYHGYLVKF